MNTPRKRTRTVIVRDLRIGYGYPIAVQSMTATKTSDVERTIEQVHLLEKAGADIIRIAVDSTRDVEALKIIRKETHARLAVDLQENYRLARDVAPYVDKIRYNPGHLYHHEKTKPVKEKVAFIARIAKEHGLAIRIGVNCGSIDPDLKKKFPDDAVQAMLESALMHAQLLEDLDFTNFVVSLKDSDPLRVIEANEKFSEKRPDIPLHIGVTEAGLIPDGVIKTRYAFERLLSKGIGDTIRVSLTLPFNEKYREIEIARQILRDVETGNLQTLHMKPDQTLNIVSCPSCSRVENERFVELAQKIREATQFAKNYPITIAVMGCRVNGPGETDYADIGVWCGPTIVFLKRKKQILGHYSYSDILDRVVEEVHKLIQEDQPEYDYAEM